MVDLRVPRLLALGGIGGRMVVLRLLQRLGTNRPGSGVGRVGANPGSKRLFQLHRKPRFKLLGSLVDMREQQDRLAMGDLPPRLG